MRISFLVLVFIFLGISTMGQNIILYQNSFENPLATPTSSNCSPDLDLTLVNTLFGGTGLGIGGGGLFQQINTVETILINGPNNQYSDPLGYGQNYCIGMQGGFTVPGSQDDKLALTLNSQMLSFLDVSFLLSKIDVPLCGGPFIIDTPKVHLSIYDSPSATFNFSSPSNLIDEDTVVGVWNNNSSYSFDWKMVRSTLNLTNLTNGNFTIVFDLVKSGYAAIDSLTIFSTNNPLGTSDFSYSDTCYTSATSFNITSPVPDSVRWDFGDINSGIANFASGPFATHVFSNPTSYTVTMIAYTGGIGDTCRKTIQILNGPQPNLGSNFNLCEGTTQLLNPGSFTGVVNYLWSDGSTGINYVVDSTEQVIVTVTDAQGCVGIDTVDVTWIQIPDVNLGANASYCDGQTINLNAFWPNATYLWQDGSTNSSLVATTTGTYIAEVTVAGCTGTDQVDLIFNPVPAINFGNDTTLCKGIPLFLDATTPNATYVWQDGSTNAYYFITDPGTYSVNVQVGACIGRDTIIIDQQEQPIVELGEDTILCYGQPYLLDAYNYGATYAWSTGETTSTIQPNQPAQYYVLAQNQCGSDADSVNVILEVCNCFVYIPTAFSPNRDNKNETFNYTYNCTDFTADFTIYNRLGQEIFKSTNPDISWDGTFEGKDAPIGVYYYILKYKGYDSGSFVDIKKKGHVTLVR